MDHGFPHLAAPIAIGPRQARNRVMRLATNSQMADRNRITERQIAFYRATARAGVGTVVSEGLRVHPSGRITAVSLSAFDRGTIPGWRLLSDAVHGDGALLIGQLTHGGRQHHGSKVSTMWAPSAIACPKSGGIPHEMTLEEIEDLIEHFAISAANLVEGGLDGVEIHGAQGHLIGQFISPFSNQRDDAFGGSFDKRLHFVRSILRRVRGKLGVAAIVGFRMAVDEFSKGGITLADSIPIAQALVGEGLVDYLSLSQGNFNSLGSHVPDRHSPPLVYLPLHEAIKNAVSGVPVIASTSIRTPEQAEAILASGKADMIGLCRALLVDPQWLQKAVEGRSAEVHRCIACNYCWDSTTSASGVTCATNPRAGRELATDALPAPARSLRVLVVGGGPAGLKAAGVAAGRGHRVVLYEREAELGGKLRLAQTAPHFSELRDEVDFLARQARMNGVEIRAGTSADMEAISAEAPDVVIVATGATVEAPAIPGDGSVPVLASDSPLPPLPGGNGRVLIMDEDGYYWGAAAAEAAAAGDRRPLFVTRFFEPFRELPAASRTTTLRTIDRLGADTRTTMFVDRIEAGRVILRHFYSDREEPVEGVAAVVWVGRQRVNDGLVKQLRAAGVERVHLIGDAFQPRRLANAILEGHDVAMRL